MDVRPLFHPSLEDITVEGILHALSDPVRAAIYADIVAQECSHNCAMFLTVSDKAIPKSTLSQHFRALREAGLIRGERRGVEMHNTSRCAEIEERFPGLLRAIVNAHTIQSNDEAQAKKRVAKHRPGGWSRISKKLRPSAELTTVKVG
jgi:DNA-binding transcriptional ArsR family regulator